MKTLAKGFIGLEIAVSIAILIALSAAAIGGYVVYHNPSPVATTTPAVDITASSTTTVGDTGGSTGSPVSPSPIVTPPPVTVTTSGAVTLTSADGEKTTKVHVGDRVLLNLGDTQNWSNIEFSNPNILVPVKGVMLVKGAQGLYTASVKGTTIITATGTAICAPREACPQYAILYTTTLVVE